MITPFRKPAGGLLDWQKEYDSEVNKIRWMIEQVISHFKNWTIVHTDYRRPLKTFEMTISAVVGLHFYRYYSPGLLPDGQVILMRPACRLDAGSGHPMLVLRDKTEQGDGRRGHRRGPCLAGETAR